MHGGGSYYYASKQPINPKHPEKGYAEAGDYLIGSWYDGYVDWGDLYNKSGSPYLHVTFGH